MVLTSSGDLIAFSFPSPPPFTSSPPPLPAPLLLFFLLLLRCTTAYKAYCATPIPPVI